MIDQEICMAARLAEAYEDQCEVDCENGYCGADIRKAFLAGRESMQSDMDEILSRDFEAYGKFIVEAERARSARLANALGTYQQTCTKLLDLSDRKSVRITSSGIDELRSIAIHALAEYEASR